MQFQNFQNSKGKLFSLINKNLNNRGQVDINQLARMQ